MINQDSLSITEKNIHLWLIDLSKKNLTPDTMKSVLDSKELNKVDGFNTTSEKESYLYFRAFLRIILSKYLEIKPKDVVINIGKRGKPFVQDSEIKFNISHKKNVAVVAVAKNCEIGVDIEDLEKKFDYNKIVKRFFLTEEKEFLRGADNQERWNKFLRIWTLREAVVKALGKSMALSINKVSILFSDRKITGIKTSYTDLNLFFKISFVLDHYICSIVTTQDKNKIKYYNV